MRIIYSKQFRKNFQKLRSGEKKKFAERVDIFMRNTSNPLLRDHPLHGAYSHLRSFNVTGDIRVLYEYVQKDTVLFIDIDTHSNLYT
ncbi:MAG: type II toxin-antitoxin system mRNA interferase toxin, RelE/StbE family [Patescibacteria group bacterium]